MNNIAYPIESIQETKGDILLDLDSEVLHFIKHYANPDFERLNVFKTATIFNIEAYSPDSLSNLVNLKRINDIEKIHTFFEKVNENLSNGGIYIGCFESKEQRKKRIFNKLSRPVAYPFYCIDFIWKRMFPKLSLTKKFYFSLTQGNNRVLSLSGVLGRLLSCGFKIEEYKEINNIVYFAIRKVDTPAYDENPTYGPLITLNRVGKDGKFIKVYKFRTMHPFAEYMQEYVYEQNKLQTGGKFKDDFRITSWGKFLRKLWLDELPMLYNWLKGDLKLVGIRPLSRQYFKLYPISFQERRKRYKPGLIPPFYVDLPETLEEIIASERKYLMEYDKNPFLTDIKYFFISLYNIIVKRARSK